MVSSSYSSVLGSIVSAVTEPVVKGIVVLCFRVIGFRVVVWPQDVGLVLMSLHLLTDGVIVVLGFCEVLYSCVMGMGAVAEGVMGAATVVYIQGLVRLNSGV